MRTMTIEGLVAWAVRDEWPKGDGEGDGPRGVASGWGGVESYVRLLTVIDYNGLGVLPDPSRSGAVHPDAAALDAVVAGFGGEGEGGERRAMRLAEIDPDWLIGDLVWRVAAERGDAVARRARGWLVERAMRAIERVAVAEDGGLVSRLPLRAVLVRRAVLGAPAWVAGGATWEHLRRPNGTPIWRRRVRAATRWNEAGEVIGWGEVEVDAHLVNGRRPGDAYPVEGLVPDPTELLAARAAYVVWRSALRLVAERVAPLLTEHVLADDDAPSLPWLARRGTAGRVLVDRGAAVHVTAGRDGRRKKIGGKA